MKQYLDQRENMQSIVDSFFHEIIYKLVDEKSYKQYDKDGLRLLA